MANPNDMSEFHSVKVSLTENIPTHRHPPASNEANSANITQASRCGCSHACLPLTCCKGEYHV